MKLFLIIAGLLVLILMLILFAHIRIRIYLSAKGKIVFRYLFLTFSYDIYGNNTKSTKKKGKKQNKAFKKKKRPNKKEKDSLFKSIVNEKGVFEGTVYFLNVLKKLFERLFSIFKSGSFEKLEFKIDLSEGDAATTAITYGGVCAVAYPIIGFLNGAFKIKNEDIDIRASYNEKKLDVYFSAYFKGRIIYCLKAFILFITDYIGLNNSN